MARKEDFMTTDQALRSSAVAAAGCGLLTVLFWFLHPSAGDPHAPHDAAYWAALASGRFMAVNVSFLCILLLSLFALLGAYVRLMTRAGTLGALGFVLAFVGTALFIGAGFFQGFIMPALGADPATRPLLEMSGPLLGGPLGQAFAGGGMIFAAGYVLFGIAVARSRVLPAGVGLLWALSSPILGLSPLMPLWARTLGSVAWGLANLWLGVALWTGADQEPRERRPAIP